MLWRVGSWQIRAVENLTLNEGLRIGSEALEVAAYAEGQEMHLSFGGRETFLVFGTKGCRPCEELVEAAAKHPATRHLRRIYVADSESVESVPEVLGSWEVYRFHDQVGTRKAWRAPVSPYFHLIDAHGRIAAKGIANRPEHLDRLLALRPPGIRLLQEAALREPLLPHTEEAL